MSEQNQSESQIEGDDVEMRVEERNQDSSSGEVLIEQTEVQADQEQHKNESHNDAEAIQPSKNEDTDAQIPSPINDDAVDLNQDQNQIEDKSNEIVQAQEAQVDEESSSPKKNQRLMISRIVLENFKSYYGRKVIGPLHKCFSAVVGPNGSGKSNLIESLLFVFGKRAKRMRLNKLSELVHCSAQHMTDVKHATVEVYFQTIIDDENEPDEFQVIEGTQFRVARRVDRNSNSKYMIDGYESSFKEVCDLLQGKGIDLEHNRFLILQGEVEQISLMKPIAEKDKEVGLLEYLEDIIGSNKHIDQIDEIEQTLRSKNDERIERINRVKQSRAELDSLEDDKDIAVLYITKERDYLLLANMLYYIELFEYVVQYNKSVENISSIKSLYQDNKQKLTAKFQENRVLVEDIKNYQNALEESDKQAKVLQNKFQKLQKNDAENCEEKEQLTKDIDKLKEKIAGIDQSKNQIITEANQIEEQLPGLQNQIKDMKGKQVLVESEFNELDKVVRQKTEDLRKEKESLNLQLTPLTNESSSLQSEIDISKSDINSFQKKSSNDRDELEKVTNKEKDFKSQLKDATQEKNKHVGLANNILKEQEDIKTSLEQHRQQSVKDENELKELRDKNNQMIRSQQEASNHKNLISSLMKAQQQGNLSGIHGRLGDLGKIDQKYDIAISSACSALNHIVVETMEDGEKAVQFLKQNKIGTATFISLLFVEEKQQIPPNCQKGQFKCPPNSTRLFDLVIQKDEKYNKVFFKFLQNTLVAQDIVQANTIAFNQPDKRRHRVVTLEGQMLEMSGLISGGGKPKSGLMGSEHIVEFSDQQKEEIRIQLQQLDSKVSNMRKNISNLELQKQQIESRIQAQNKEVDKAQAEENLVNMQLERVTIQIEQLQRFSNEEESPDDKIKQMEESIKINQKKLMQVQPQIDQVKQKIQSIEQSVMRVGGCDYQQKKDLLDRMSESLQKMEKQETRFRTTLESSEANIKRVDVEAKTLSIKLEKNIKRKVVVEEKIQKNEDDGINIQRETEENDKQKNESLEKLQDRKADYNKMKESMTELDKEKEEIRQKLEAETANKDKYGDQSHKMKTGIKENKQKYKKSKKEFDGILNEPEFEEHKDEQEGEERDYNYFFDRKMINFSFTNDDIEKYIKHHRQEIRNKAQQIRDELQEQAPNVDIIHQYKEKLGDYQQKESVLRECEQLIKDQREEFNRLKQFRQDEFMKGFKKISASVKEMYRLITCGGDAELEIKDTLDPFAEGVLFQVRPKNKTWKHMSKLSGGEKTLSSLSLIFALHCYKPSPLYCMDEIDAALDYKNVAVVGKYIREKAKNCQFIIISLRNNMFDLAQKMVGIYKTSDVTKTLTISPSLLEKQLQEGMKQILEQVNDDVEENDEANQEEENLDENDEEIELV